METVIPPEKTGGHIIRKYRFKVLAQEGAQQNPPSGTQEGGVRPYTFSELASSEDTGEIPQQEHVEENTPSKEKEEESMPAPEASTEHQGEMMEEMLKRVDELTSELVKTQMELEKERQAIEERLEETKKTAYDDGVEAGRELCTREMSQKLEEMRARFASAIEALEESRRIFLGKVDTIEEELIETALDLARQVVAKEIESNAQDVALRLARLLLAEVKDAAKIKLKLNPEDFDYVKDHLETTKNIKIVPDPAVGPGGVVILSEIGNIDGEIMHRFERIKEAVFGTVKQG
ncbi:flagellar assembly protein FliH [Hydrogenimonas urashimensis]|uniref:flagellar assembly protein FliH n=1 Tax=Hydrogenimonas urashimensis TaxID=2740515 RepID=UPI001915DDAE|nr:flagellar assembly protein FliH [Hydrogenimonas urashimensis]